MKFVSTRTPTPPVNFMTALAQGLAPDGGLYIPETVPDLSGYFKDWEPLPYVDLAEAFLSQFITDVDRKVLRQLLEKAYSSFTHPEVAPLVGVDDRLFFLELFYGPTLAFKDLALQPLGAFYEMQMRHTGEPINVLGVTSGDTGAAAIHGLMGQKGVRIFMLYPKGRIAPLQERQMTCTQAENVFPIAIEGTYDDAHRIVKALFADNNFHSRYRLSAVNSINVARLLFQAVYFLYAYFRLPQAARSHVEFAVPSGNGGNALAGSWLKNMGLPFETIRVATNQNDVLARLLKTGVYEPSKVHPSLAPSMDIQMPSNFERFLFTEEHRDTGATSAILKVIKETGRYVFEDFDPLCFTTSSATDAEILEIIGDTYERYGRVIDTHTACALKSLNHSKNTICLSTAHPAKFAQAVGQALGFAPTHPFLEALWDKSMKQTVLPANEEAVRELIEKHAL